ncbi:MAG: hypothetical protein KDA55_01465 [Planctomycetales bacterium]|nr:hypothetical protein [Planctomycetales bacterium]
MAARKLILGKPPFRLLADHLAQDDDFLHDVKPIIDLDEELYSQLSARLAQSDSFLSHANLAAIAERYVGSDSSRIATIICRIGEIVHGADMNATDAMNALAKSIETKTESLAVSDRHKLVERLRRLVIEPIGIAKHYKARELVDATGAELDSFRIICDIRPIFDRQRERIDGALPLTILRFEYSTPDGESDVVEFRVTEQQIGQLEEKISDAKLKLRVIKELMSRQDIPIPETTSTMTMGE